MLKTVGSFIAGHQLPLFWWSAGGGGCGAMEPAQAHCSQGPAYGGIQTYVVSLPSVNIRFCSTYSLNLKVLTFTYEDCTIYF